MLVFLLQKDGRTSTTVLCTLHKPYKTPGLLPTAFIFLYCCSVKLPFLRCSLVACSYVLRDLQRNLRSLSSKILFQICWHTTKYNKRNSQNYLKSIPQETTQKKLFLISLKPLWMKVKKRFYLEVWISLCLLNNLNMWIIYWISNRNTNI